LGGLRHAQASLPPGKRLGTYYAGGWVEPDTGLDGYGKTRPIRLRTSDRSTNTN